ncbi:hypothetical protein [Methyloglobulus sp.]|uniref:hypothetical protein n=1 Tax=Methyloglobulus sp. TaxID=2518622 RepID=UPI00398A2188
MKKLLNLIQLTAVAVLFSSAAFADDGDWGGRGHHGWGHHGGRHSGHHGWGRHGGHHGHHGWGRHGGYLRQQVNNYYPQPQANYYYQQPPVDYYPPQPQYYGGGYDGRSHQGLAGGVIGTVFGYELGNGHPLATGIGAAAGSFLGNGVGWRY